MTGTVIVGPLSMVSLDGGVCRVTADVSGEPLWFETAETGLRPSPEGFASALLVPAMSHGRDLIFDDPLSPLWIENAQKLMGYFSTSFGWKPIRITSRSLYEAPDVNDLPGRRYLCFSGGVDSFYSLLTYPEPIDALMMVHGYDIRLDDTVGAQFAFDHVRRVASEMNLHAVMVRTNYREHSVAGKKYKYAYGGALAGVGHLLNHADELIISSGLRYDEVLPNGSQWQIDPLWSSRQMQVVHYGAQLAKDDKVRAIGAVPLVRSHLRICQENLSGQFSISEKVLNCGRCQKCVRFLLVLGQEPCGIDDLDIFENKKDLDVYLGQEVCVGEYLYPAYNEILRRGVEPRIARAIRALIRRSKVLNRMGWAGRKGRKVAYQGFRVMDAVERKFFCN